MTVLHAEMDSAIKAAKKAMRERLDQAIGALEASIAHVNDAAQRRVDKLENAVAADAADVRQRLVESEDGIVRHRDHVMRELTALAADVRALNARIDHLSIPVPQGTSIAVPWELWRRIKKSLVDHADGGADEALLRDIEREGLW